MSGNHRNGAILVLSIVVACALQDANCFPSDILIETKHSPFAAEPTSSFATASFGGEGNRKQGGDQDQTVSGDVPITRQRADQRDVMCRIVNSANGTVIESHPCPNNASCTIKHSSANVDVETFYCSIPSDHRPALSTAGSQQPQLIKCRVVNLETNRTEIDIECPLGSTCSGKMSDPTLSHDNQSEIHYCTHTNLETGLRHPSSAAAAAAAGAGQFPSARCRVVSKDNNATIFTFQCPPGSSCDELDKTNPDASTEIYFCGKPTTQQMSDHRAGFSELTAAGGSQQKSKRCRVFDKVLQEVLLNEECPPGSSCELFDQLNSNTKADIFLCTQPMEKERPSLNPFVQHNGSS